MTFRNGQAVRETASDRHGRPTRRERGVVVAIGNQLVSVYWERRGTISGVFPDEIEPTKRRVFDRLLRENKRLRRVIRRVVEARRAANVAYSSRSPDEWETHDAAVIALDKALAPYEREAT